MKKIKRTPGYRTPIDTLKKLAVSDMYYTMKGNPEKIRDQFPLTGLSLNTTRLIGERFGGDRHRALTESADQLAATLGTKGRKQWPATERLWFERLAPMFLLIPGLEKWSAREKKDLEKLIRAKGSPQESGFVRLLAGNRKLRRALEKTATEK